ncbi:MAG: branched-chain amino acid transporter permease [Lachnospiraceae bacterium]
MEQINITNSILIIVVMMVGTMITRFLPFFIFPPGKPTPPIINYLGKSLPYATMSLLVVYCLKHVSVMSAPHGVPEVIAVLLIVILHRWKRNSLLSIGAGTVCYMLLVQKIFA